MKKLNLVHNLPLLISLVAVLVTMPLAVILVVTQSVGKRPLAAPASSVYFVNNTAAPQINQAGTANAMIDPGTNKVTAVELHITYDPAMITITNIIPSSFFPNVLKPFTTTSINTSTSDSSVIVNVPAPDFDAGQTINDVAVKSLSSIATVYYTPLQSGQIQLKFGSNTQASGYTIGVDLNGLPDEKENIISLSANLTLNVSGIPTLTPTNTPTPTPSNFDVTSPVVTISTPLNNAKLPSRGSTTITAKASDKNGIAWIKIYIDQVLKKTCNNVTSCSYLWKVTALPVGSHNIKATAIDKAGNIGNVSIIVNK